jgi:hypothetical protein
MLRHVRFLVGATEFGERKKKATHRNRRCVAYIKKCLRATLQGRAYQGSMGKPGSGLK